MKTYIKCPVCNKKMIIGKIIGKVENKIVSLCENEECKSVLVFGDSFQERIK